MTATAVSRSHPDVAREIYMPKEILPEVIRAELDLTKAALERVRSEIAEQSAATRKLIDETKSELRGQMRLTEQELKANHDSYGKRFSEQLDRINNLEKLRTSLVGLTETGEDIGRIGRLEQGSNRLWDRLSELKTKYWRLTLIVVGTGAAGLGSGVGLSQLLGL